MVDRRAQADKPIFISYARADDEPFVRRLYHDLHRHGLNVWWDRVSMPSRALTFLQEIRDAIDGADRLMLIAGPGAFKSDYVRAEWEYALNSCKVVIPILRKCDYKDLPPELGMFHAIDCRQDGFLNRTYAAKLNELLRILETPEQPVGKVLVEPLPPHFIARPEDLDAIAEFVLADVNRPTVVTSAKQTTSLRGMGGVGKTVLAKAFCHDCRTRRAFSDGLYWITLGQTPNVLTTLMTLGTQLGDSPQNYPNEPVGTARLREVLADKSALIVLDDVWRPEHAKPFLVGGPRCRLLITTRLYEVVSAVSGNERKVGALPTEKALALLSNWADGIPDAERDTALEIAEQCGYLPLALSIAGAMLRDRRARWSDVLDALRKAELEFLDNEQGSVAASIKTSLDYLASSFSPDDPDRVLRRYEWLAVFPEDVAVPGTTLIRFWTQGGLAERDTVRLLAEMVNKALLFREEGDRYRLHDLQRDYIRYLLAKRGISDLTAMHQTLVDAWGDPLLAPLPDEYAYRYYAYHLQGAGRLIDLRPLLLNADWLRRKLGATDIAALLADYEFASPGDEPLHLVRSALSLSAHVLSLEGEKRQLSSQLRGRLFVHRDEPDIQHLMTSLAPESGTFSALEAPLNATHIQAGGALLRTLAGHTNFVTGALVLPDGRFLSWSGDSALRLWTVDGMPLRTLEGHRRSVAGALALADGRLLSWSDDSTLRLWTVDGMPLRTLEGHTATVYGALALADGRFLSWGRDGTLRLWTPDGTLLSALEGHTSTVYSALVLPDGRFLSCSADRTLRLWTADGMPLRTLEGHADGVRDALALADGRFLSWSADRTLRLWTADGMPLRTLEGHTATVFGALALADGRFLSWSMDSTLRLWTPDGTLLRTLEGHTDSVRGALALADGRFMSWSDDSTLRLWAADGMPLRTLEGHGNNILGALALADGRFLSWSMDNTLRLWTPDGTLLSTLEGHTSNVFGALALADGRFLSWGVDGTLRLWTAGKSLPTLARHTDSVRGALALADGRFLSWSIDGTLRLWAKEGASLCTLAGHMGSVTGALALTDGRFLSWSEDCTLRLWAADGASLRMLGGHRRSVTGALALADGRFLSWSEDCTLRLWAPDGTPLQALKGHRSGVTGALALADGRFLSWAGGPESEDCTLRLWAPDGTPLQALKGHRSGVTGALALASGRFLSWSQDGTLRVWTAEGILLRTFDRHSPWVMGALELIDGRSLLPRVMGALALVDGRFLSWSAGVTLRLWTPDGTPLKALKGHRSDVIGALALADGRFLSWSMDRTLRLWTPDGTLLQTLEGHTGGVQGALALADGCFLSWAGLPGSQDCTLRLWTADGTPCAAFYGDTPITCCTLSRDEQVVVAGDQQGRVMFLRLPD